MDEGTTLRQLFDVCVGLEGLTSDPVLVSNYLSALYSFARQSGGITLVGSLTVWRRLEPGKMVAVPTRNAELSRRSVQIQSMARRTLPAAVREFLTHLIARIGAPDGPRPGGGQQAQES